LDYGNPSVRIRLISFKLWVGRRATKRRSGSGNPGSSMLQTGHAIRLRARQGLLLNVALAAWLGIMLMPCSVLATETVAPEAGGAATLAPDCHGAHSEATTEKTLGCDCDLLSVTVGEGPKTQRADLTAAATPTAPLAPASLTAVSADRVQPPPSNHPSPPVYLATQRLRI